MNIPLTTRLLHAIVLASVPAVIDLSYSIYLSDLSHSIKEASVKNGSAITKMLKPNNGQTTLMSRLRDNVGLGDRILPAARRRLATGSVASLCNLDLDGEGCNRRAIGLLPMPKSRQEHEVAETDSLQLKKLLLSVEARAVSCCIRVFSDCRKSRSALLVYRGRLIGCLYGSKDLHDQDLGKAAFAETLDDMLMPGNFIDTYMLSDEIVLAGASLFHGGLNTVNSGASASSVYPNCARMFIKNARTGCIVVKGRDNDKAICTTYIYEGKIVGVYAFSTGWLTPTQTAALDCIDNVQDTEVCMSVLSVETDAVHSLTESLTGLDLGPQV